MAASTYSTRIGSESLRLPTSSTSSSASPPGGHPAQNRPSGNRARDCAVVNWYCERAAQEGPPIMSVRAIFEEGDPIFESSAIRALSHTQIAVRDPSVILEIEELPW